MKNFVFVSGNLKKAHYLEKFLGQKVKHHKLDLTEIQSLNPLKVVEHKAKEAYKILKMPVLIEDTSLKFTAFGELPGTFVKFFLEEVGNNGMAKMLNAFENRNATAEVIYGYYDGQNFKAYRAELKGLISNVPKEKRGMGWDPIFIPNGQNKTYGEMTEREYNKYSVRNMAVQKLKKDLK